MKRIIFLFAISFCSLSGLMSKQWIVFFAKEGFFDGILRQSFGHAYIGLVWEDPALHQKVLVDCFGFYPKGGIQSEGIFGYMDGEVRDDVASLREHDFAIEITEQELLSCLILKKVWEHKQYSLISNNCLDFLRTYCKSISDLKVPDGFYLLPSTYINELRNENPNRETKEQLKDVVEMDDRYKGKFGFIKKQAHLIHEKFKKIKLHTPRFFSKRNKSLTKDNPVNIIK